MPRHEGNTKRSKKRHHAAMGSGRKGHQRKPKAHRQSPRGKRRNKG